MDQLEHPKVGGAKEVHFRVFHVLNFWLPDDPRKRIKIPTRLHHHHEAHKMEGISREIAHSHPRQYPQATDSMTRSFGCSLHMLSELAGSVALICTVTQNTGQKVLVAALPVPSPSKLSSIPSSSIAYTLVAIEHYVLVVWNSTLSRRCRFGPRPPELLSKHKVLRERCVYANVKQSLCAQL